MGGRGGGGASPITDTQPAAMEEGDKDTLIREPHRLVPGVPPPARWVTCGGGQRELRGVGELGG